MLKPFFVFVVLLLGDVVWYLRAVSWGENPLMYSPGSPWYDAGSNLNIVLFVTYSAVVLVSFGFYLGRWSRRRT